MSADLPSQQDTLYHHACCDANLILRRDALCRVCVILYAVLYIVTSSRRLACPVSPPALPCLSCCSPPSPWGYDPRRAVPNPTRPWRVGVVSTPPARRCTLSR